MAVTQSMSKADIHMIMHQWKVFQHVKNELIYQHEYQTEEALYTAIERICLHNVQS